MLWKAPWAGTVTGLVGKEILSIVGRVTDVLLIVCLTAGYILGWGATRLAWLYASHRHSGLQREREILSWALPSDATLPAILIQIPTFNEGALIWRALAAVTALEWPRDRLQVQVLDDSPTMSRAPPRKPKGRPIADPFLQRKLLQRSPAPSPLPPRGDPAY